MQEVTTGLQVLSKNADISTQQMLYIHQFPVMKGLSETLRKRSLNNSYCNYIVGVKANPGRRGGDGGGEGEWKWKVGERKGGWTLDEWIADAWCSLKQIGKLLFA